MAQADVDQAVTRYLRQLFQMKSYRGSMILCTEIQRTDMQRQKF